MGVVTQVNSTRCVGVTAGRTQPQASQNKKHKPLSEKKKPLKQQERAGGLTQVVESETETLEIQERIGSGRF
jgi:hypothetical protein